MKVLLTTLLFITFSLMSFTAKASGINNQYTVHEDAQGNIYLERPDVFVLIATDVSIPLWATPRNGLLKLVNVNGRWQIIQLTRAQWEALSLVASNYQVSMGDFDGDGSGDLFLTAGDANSLVIKGLSATPSIVDVSKAYGVKFEAGDEVQLVDRNGDGFIDIRINNRVYLANSVGGFSNTGMSVHVTVPGKDATVGTKSGPVKATQVGLTKAQFSVNEGGAATYSIPLSLPQGVAGVKPQVSLNYSSQGGEGLMGVGWSFGGASAITRCPKNMAIDGVIDSVKFNGNDVFCLGGQRLILNANSPAGYGESGSTYHTEIESFSRITAHGKASVSGPKYFTVETKANETHYYGDSGRHFNSSSAFVEPSNQALGSVAKYWSLVAIEDVKHNAITYEYDKGHATGEHYLTSIKYGGYHSGGGTNVVNNTNEIEVNYSKVKSPKYKMGYQNGAMMSSRKRIESIDVLQDQELFTTYNFHYEESDIIEEKTYINAIQQCFNKDATALNCLPALTFEWQRPQWIKTLTRNVCEKNDKWQGDQADLCYSESTKENYEPISTQLRQLTSKSPNHQFAMPLDFDGDGATDLAYIENNSWNIQKASKAGGLHWASQSISSALISDVSTAYPKSIDYNGDGMRDIIYASQGRFVVLMNKPSEITVPPKECKFDPEKLISVEEACPVKRVKRSFTSITIQGNVDKFETAMVVDLDGDGLEDLLIDDNGLKYYKNSTTGFGTPIPLQRENEGTITKLTAHINSLAKGVRSASVVDVNGDGKTDIFLQIARTERIDFPTGEDGCNSGSDNGGNGPCAPFLTSTTYSWEAYTLKGNKLVELTAFKLNDPLLKELRSADFNGDGLSDVAYRVNDSWSYRLSTGTAFTTPQPLTLMGKSTDSNDFARHRFIDINKDGRTDIVKYHDSGLYQYFLSAPYTNPEVINFISRGSQNFGVNSTIHFVDLEGDGKLDVLSATSNDSGWGYYRSMRPGRLDNVINTFKNGFGPETKVEYAPLYHFSVLLDDASTNKLNNDYLNLKAGIYVVANVETVSTVEPATKNKVFNDFFDPELNTWLAVPRTVTKPDNVVRLSYKYGGALAHKKGRGFLGFEVLQTHDYQTNVITETQYHQLFPLTGMPKATRVSHKGNLLKASKNTYAEITSAQGARQPYLKKAQEITQTATFNDEVATYSLQKLVVNESVYDGWNNLISSKVTAGKPASLSLDSAMTDKSVVTTVNAYAANGMSTADSVRFGRLSSTTVNKKRDASVADHGAAGISRTSSFGYYSDGLLKTSAVNGLTTSYVYDERGNKKKITKRGLVDGSVMQERTSSMDYGERGRYVLSQTDGLGNTETFLYNGVSGESVRGRVWSIAQTGPNKIASTSHFGWQGEKVQTVAADGNEVISSMTYCHSGCNGDEFYYTTTTKTGAPTSTAFFNRLGQKIKTQTESFDGRLVQVIHQYDKQGRPYKVSQPHFNGDTAYYTQQFYNPLGGVYKTLMPDPVYNDLYTTQYNNGFTKTITNTKGITFTEVYSADGLITKKTTPSFVTNGVTTPEQTITYSYGHYGNLTKVVTKVGSKTLTLTNDFNSWGQKTATNDPDKGRWTYKYNGFGELYSQTTAKGDTTTMHLDTLGRMVRREQAEGSTCWTYGNSVADKNVGKLITVKQWNSHQACNSPATPEYMQQVTYDKLGRPSTTTTHNKGEVFVSSVTYDSLGRVQETVYPKGVHSFSVKQHYNARGYLTEQRHGRTGKLLRQIKQMNALGRVTEDIVGNGVKTTRDFYAQNGRIRSITAKGSAILHNLSYREYDRVGNLVARDTGYKTFGTGGYTFNETFSYDAIDRLTKRQLAANSSPNSDINGDFNYVYDGFGNFKTKTNVGTYHYNDATRANRLTSISGSTNYNFQYDANGNVTNDGIRRHEYTSFDKAQTIRKGEVYTQYAFGPSREVIYREDYLEEKNDVGTLAWRTKQTHYAGKSYQKERTIEAGSADKVKHTYFAGGIMVVQYASTGIEKTNYLHGDYQGSTITITDDNAQIMQQYFYTPFGEQKTAFVGGLNRLLSVMPVGYTGHEMVNHLNIIQMGGRTYDAKIGRFLQADIHVQAPGNLQNYNKYSYVMNNPYTYTDPSGYSWWTKVRDKWLKPIVAIVVAYYTGQWANGLSWFSSATANAAVTGAFAGAASGAVTSGSLKGAFKGAITGAISGAVFSKIGAQFNDTPLEGGFGHIASHAVAGGVLAELQGGKFGHGFISAGIAKGMNANDVIGIDADKAFSRVLFSAVVGGTVSKLTGGKFGNGAVTAAFAQMFNGEKGAEISRAIEEIERFSSFVWNELLTGKHSEQARADLMEVLGIYGKGAAGLGGAVGGIYLMRARPVLGIYVALDGSSNFLGAISDLSNKIYGTDLNYDFLGKGYKNGAMALNLDGHYGDSARAILSLAVMIDVWRAPVKIKLYGGSALQHHVHTNGIRAGTAGTFTVDTMTTKDAIQTLAPKE